MPAHGPPIRSRIDNGEERELDGFKAFWNGNTLMIGIAMAVLAIGAAFLNLGTVAAVFGMLSGMAFMWMAKPELPVEDE